MENTNQLKPRVSRLVPSSLLCVIISIAIYHGPWLYSGRTQVWIKCYSAFVFSILAVILGIIAFCKISRNRKRLKGRGWAIAGIVLGILLSLLNESSIARTRTSFKKADVAVVEADFDYLTTALQKYYNDVGHYPSTNAGLKALRKYVKVRSVNETGNPIDPWDNEYRYTSDGKSFTILSYGADGKPGGTGFNADITSEQIKRGEKLWQ